MTDSPPQTAGRRAIEVLTNAIANFKPQLGSKFMDSLLPIA